MAPARPFDRVNRGRGVDPEDAQRLLALLALHRLAKDSRAFERRIETVALEATQMEEHIRHAIVGDDEAIAPPDIKPLYESADLEDLYIHVGSLMLMLPVCLEGPANRHDHIPELVAALPQSPCCQQLD